MIESSHLSIAIVAFLVLLIFAGAVTLLIRILTAPTRREFDGLRGEVGDVKKQIDHLGTELLNSMTINTQKVTAKIEELASEGSRARERILEKQSVDRVKIAALEAKISGHGKPVKEG